MSQQETLKPVHLVIFNDDAVLLFMLNKILDDLSERSGIPASAIIYHAQADDLNVTSLWDNEQIIVFTEPDKDTLKDIAEYAENPSDDRIVVIATTKPQALFRKKLKDEYTQIYESKTSRSADIIAPLLSYLNLDAGAKMTIIDSVGDSVDQVPSIVDTLLAVHGQGKKLNREDVMPWLTPGTLPIWALTDAIDRGNTTQALLVLDRIWNSSTPVGITGALKMHMERIYLMHQTGIVSEREAGAFLGMKGSTYPAKKAIQAARIYGNASETLLQLILKADSACKGGSGRGVPQRLTIEVLVARLCAYPRG